VRRELAFNFARFTPNPESLEVLPDWCRRTMKKDAKDKRLHTYTSRQFEAAETHDALWNAAQKELLLRGTIHGYYRMYWGKKIIEWTPTYEQALHVMIHLHDIYALDGRDPNMSLHGMRRKTDTEAYIAEIAGLERTGRDLWRI
jgi:deoxyribodipyrimidine photo-lyase